MPKFILPSEVSLPDFLCNECENQTATVNYGVCQSCFQEQTKSVYRIRLQAEAEIKDDVIDVGIMDLSEYYLQRFSLKEAAYSIGIPTADIKLVLKHRHTSIRAIRREAGIFTLQRLIDISGYNRIRLLEVRDILQQTWGNDASTFLITTAQTKAIDHYFSHMKTPYIRKSGMQAIKWSKRFDKCLGCDTNGNEVHQRHKAFGLCRDCFRRNCQTKKARTEEYILVRLK